MAAELADELATKDPDVKVTAKRLTDAIETITCAAPEETKEWQPFTGSAQRCTGDERRYAGAGTDFSESGYTESRCGSFTGRVFCQKQRGKREGQPDRKAFRTGGTDRRRLRGDRRLSRLEVPRPFSTAGKMVKLYAEMYGNEPRVEAIHAGLECGLLGSKISDLDCVSMGPDMKDIHTTEETLSISSTKRVWEYLVRVLETKD